MRTLYGAITKSLNGMAYSRVAAITGDWKWLQEAFELKRLSPARLHSRCRRVISHVKSSWH
jgi:hypothetical protein